MRISVIGAGASGLVAAKKLLDQGLTPTVYERSAELGGNWLYGAPGSSEILHSHSYKVPEQAELVARALKHPSPRLRAAVADRQDTRYFDYLPSPRNHLEVDYRGYERDLRRLLRLTGGREAAA